MNPILYASLAAAVILYGLNTFRFWQEEKTQRLRDNPPHQCEWESFAEHPVSTDGRLVEVIYVLRCKTCGDLANHFVRGRH